MKHTPGPWRAWNSVGSVILKSWRVGESNTCEGVVRPVAVVSNENRSSEEELANATLIAAAPELLEALEGVCRCLYSVQKHIDNDYALGFIVKAEALAINALKKAKGKA